MRTVSTIDIGPNIGRPVRTRFFGKSVKTPKMATRLPILLLFLWLLCSSLAAAVAIVQPQGSNGPNGKEPVRNALPAGKPAPVSRAQSRLEDAILALESRFSISASIRHEADLFGKRVFGSGIYREQRSGPNPLLRLELKMQLGDRVSTMVQVCDGRYLWLYWKLLDEGTLSRIDVVRVGRAIEKSGDVPQPGRIDKWPGIGGLAKLLRSLNAAFSFESLKEGQLQTRAGQVPVWKLRGQWKPEKLVAVLPDQKEAIGQGKPPDLNRLPKHLPDHVVIFLGKQDLFPYRIEYRREQPKGAGQPDNPRSRPIVTMQLYEVNLNVPIDPTRFIYNPGNLKYSDRTQAFLEKLGLEE